MYTYCKMNMNEVYMNADAKMTIMMMIWWCVASLHSWHNSDDGGFNPIVRIGVFDVCDDSLVEGGWPSVHLMTIWYHMHSYDGAFHDMWHCICMVFLVNDVCDVDDTVMMTSCCPVYVLLFISFIMNCEYSPFCWCSPYHGQRTGTQEEQRKFEIALQSF